MKKLREILGEKFSKGMEDWLKNNQTTRNMQAREPTEPPKFPPLDPNWAEKMHDKFNAVANRRDAPRTVIPGPVDFTGSRHSAGSDDVKLVDPSLNQNWRSKKEGIGSYQQPPGFGTPYPVEGGKLEPSNKKMRDAYDAMGIRNPTYSDPLKTPPIIPVTADKPYNSGKFNSALAAKGYDQSGKKVTAIPKQTGVGKAEIPLPSNEKIPSGVGITTPGSFTYSEPEKKPKQITDRVPPSKLYTDRVPQTKQITDRVPQEPPNVSTKALGPFTISKDDPSSLRYQKVTDISKYAPRTRTAPETKQSDNTKGVVPIPKPTSTSLDFGKPSTPKKLKTITLGSDKNTNTLWDIAKSRVGKGGDISKEVERLKTLNKISDPRKLKKGQSLTVEAATFPNTKYVPGLTQPGKQMDKKITDRVPETIPKQYTDRVPQENPKPTVSPQKFYDVPAGTFRPQYELQKGDLGPKTMKRLSTEVPKGSSDAAYAAMVGSILNRVGDKGFTSNKSIGQVFSDKSQFPKQPKTKVTPEFEKRMTSIATDVAAGKFPPVEKGADQWRATSYLKTPRDEVWGKQNGKKVMGGEGKPAYRSALDQNAPEVGKQTFIKSSPSKGLHDPYELPKMTKDPNTGVIRKAEAGEPVLPEKGFASFVGMAKNKPSTVTDGEAKKEVSAVHKVRKGQSAEQIAKQYNLDLNKLEKLNPGITKKSNRGKLMPGDTIKVK